jgi:transcriptional regulator with XRE-family HTH domain
MSVGLRIKKFRKSLGLSQREFAREIRIAKTTLSRYENGHLNPGSDIVERIVSVFKAKRRVFYEDNDTTC